MPFNGDYVEADLNSDQAILAHQVDVGLFIPPPEVPDTLIAFKFMNNFPKEIITKGYSTVVNRATAQFVQQDTTKPGTKASVYDVDFMCSNTITESTETWTGFKSSNATITSLAHDPEFLRTDFSADMFGRKKADGPELVSLFDEGVPPFEELYYHKELQEGCNGEDSLMMPCIALFIVPPEQVNIKTTVKLSSTVEFAETISGQPGAPFSYDKRPIAKVEQDFGGDSTVEIKVPKAARVVSEAFLKQKDDSREIQQSVNMIYKINEEVDVDDEFMFAFNLTMDNGAASPMESDDTVQQYISFRPKNTPTKWTTVVCETSMNVTDYTGKAADFKYAVTNF